MMPSDTVWPRSGWATMSASAMTAAGISGISISRSAGSLHPAGGQQMRAPDHERDLGQFRGLHRQSGEDEPAAGAVGFVADPGDEHQHQHDDGDREGREGGAAQEPDRQPQRDPAGEQAHRRPHHLAGEDRPGRAVLVVGVHAGGRQHHDQAEGGQQCGHRDHQVKRRHRPGQPGAELRAGWNRSLVRIGGPAATGAAPSPATGLAVARLGRRVGPLGIRSRIRGGRRSRTSAAQPGPHGGHLPGRADRGGERLTTVGIAGELVERRTGRGQQHRVAGARQAGCGRRPPRPSPVGRGRDRTRRPLESHQ